MSIDTTLRAVDDLLLSIVDSSVPFLRQASEHVLAAGGKRLRPRLVLLGYTAAGGQELDSVIPLAATVEIIHTATLIHDDINDQGTVRRGRETISARWGRTAALLTGDYMFTRAYQLMAHYSGDLNMILARAATDLVEGETLQILASKEGNLTRELYAQIIAKKTASLFAASAELGGAAAGASSEWNHALRDYGFNVGLAFQIVDDVLDLVGDAALLGKNTGVDVAQGRGLAVALEAAGTVSAATAVKAGALSDHYARGGTLDDVVNEGRAKARELVDRAVACLDVLPPSPARDELHALARQVIERDH